MNNWMFTAVCGAAVLVAFAAQAQEPQSLGEVVVSGWASAAAERRDATTQKVIMERKDIENLGVMTIGEVLGKLPGVEVQGDAQRATRARHDT